MKIKTHLICRWTFLAHPEPIHGPLTSRWIGFVGDNNNLSPCFIRARPGPNRDRLEYKKSFRGGLVLSVIELDFHLVLSETLGKKVLPTSSLIFILFLISIKFSNLEFQGQMSRNLSDFGFARYYSDPNLVNFLQILVFFLNQFLGVLFNFFPVFFTHKFLVGISHFGDSKKSTPSLKSIHSCTTNQP